MTDKMNDLSDTTFDVKEFEVYKFSYPLLAMIKGGRELIRYDFSTREYYYAKLSAPMSLVQSGKRNEVVFKGLLDLGKYYAKTTINFEGRDSEMTLETDLKYIVKKKLPEDKLLNILPETKVMFMNRKEEDAFVLHFVNSILAYNKGKEVRTESKKFRYTIDEVLWYCGLILYKKEAKKIVLIDEPIDFNDRSRYHIIYETQDILKNVRITNDFGKYKFYIADEMKFLKVGYMDPEREKKEIEITDEYYVSKDFIGDSDFIVKEDMIYQDYEGTLLQKRENKNKDIFTKYSADLKGESLGCPISSDNSLLFVSDISTKNPKRQATVMAVFSSPLYSVMSSYFTEEITAEFYFYSRSLNQEFMVFLRQNDYEPYLIFDFYSSNGEYVFTKRHSIPGLARDEYGKLNVQISPNGKYLFYKEPYESAHLGKSGTLESSKFGDDKYLSAKFGSKFERSEMHEGGESSEYSEEESSSSDVESSQVIPASSTSEQVSSGSTYKSSEEPSKSSTGEDSKVKSSTKSPPQHAYIEDDRSMIPPKGADSGNTPESDEEKVPEQEFKLEPMSEEGHEVGALPSPPSSEDEKLQEPIDNRFDETSRIKQTERDFEIDEEKHQGFYANDSSRMEGKIFELVLVRRSSTLQEIFQMAKTLQKDSHKKRTEIIEDKIHDDE